MSNILKSDTLIIPDSMKPQWNKSVRHVLHILICFLIIKVIIKNIHQSVAINDIRLSAHFQNCENKKLIFNCYSVRCSNKYKIYEMKLAESKEIYFWEGPSFNILISYTRLVKKLSARLLPRCSQRWTQWLVWRFLDEILTGLKVDK